jgi:hypothetical protein
LTAHPAGRREAARSPFHVDSLATLILEMQQTLGNQAVQQRAAGCPAFGACPTGGAYHASPVGIQAKLSVGQPGDAYEQEADWVAEQMMRMPDPRAAAGQGPSARIHTPRIQRLCPGCEQKEESLQAKESSGRIPGESPTIEGQVTALQGGGQPLPEFVRAFFEPRFGYDLSDVRIHTNARAAQSARSINALAYCVGRDIVFAAGQYAPQTMPGRRLLAHELTHVVQQDQGASEQQHLIQRWSLEAHESLTNEGIQKLFPFFLDFKMDSEALSTLVVLSHEMDRRLAELWFNIGAVTAKSPKAISEFYRKQPERAKNHGEGGMYSSSRSEAAALNEEHQEGYERRAEEAFQSLPQVFHSFPECESTRSSVREKVLTQLGNALHVAQDRGAHGEGAFGLGHQKALSDRKFNSEFDPDDPASNSEGFLEAQRNTELVLLRAFSILHKLLDTRYARTCNVVEPAQVQHAPEGVIQRKLPFGGNKVSSSMLQCAAVNVAGPALISITISAIDQEFFKNEYSQDRENQKKQKLEEYLEYVRQFYEGTTIMLQRIPGWNSRVQEILSVLKSEEEKSRTKAKLEGLGKRIAVEWAKDNAVRKISTNDVKRWGSELEKAREEERGGRKKLDEVINRIEVEVQQKLKPKK